MEINFETKHLDVSLYQRMILKYIYDHYHYKIIQDTKLKINGK